jgi:acyl-homoserine-lactone acylase
MIMRLLRSAIGGNLDVDSREDPLNRRPGTRGSPRNEGHTETERWTDADIRGSAGNAEGRIWAGGGAMRRSGGRVGTDGGRTWAGTAGRGILVLLAAGSLLLHRETPAAPPPPPGPPEPSEAVASQGTASDFVGAASNPATYRATIRRSAYGVAHIEAADLAGLGFGEGYAQAEDHLCTIAEQIMVARGERSRYLGPGEGDAHLVGDLAVKALGVRSRAIELLAEQPPEIRGWLDGFAAGYNRYLEGAGPEEIPGWCRGAEWVVPISWEDVAAYTRMGTLSSLGLAPAIVQAAPPGTAETEPSLEVGWSWDRLAPDGTASNGWALGRDRSASGRGMLVANPHYPWTGANRFWEKHLTIPGELNVYGVNLIGVPGVGIGFNEHVAWTHTSSTGTRRTLYALELDPEDPTRYRHGEEVRQMTSREVVVEARGHAEPVRRTVWRSHHGPIVGAAPLQWTRERAYAVRDAGEDNLALSVHMLAIARARSVEELREVHVEHQAVVHFNTIAADAGGEAWYIHSSATPNLSPRALELWQERVDRDPLVGQMARQGAILLDGSDPFFDWVDAPEAARPGIVPVRDLPELRRTDYVFNANDSYWAPHGEVRLEGGYSPLLGREGSALSLRSRNNVLHLENRVPGIPAGEDNRFTLEALQAAIRSERSLAADLLVPELVQRCRATPRVTLEAREEVDLGFACSVLDGWDRRFGLESRGAVLFREWVSRYEWSDMEEAGALFAEDFDPRDPVNTPRGLAPGGRALEELARAVRVLEGRGLALDVPLGEIQYAGPKGSPRIPIPGGHGFLEGVLSFTQFVPRGVTLQPLERPAGVPGSRFLTEAGYPVFDGTSFLLALEFTDDGPRAQAVLTYGQSGNPDSAHFRDQTELYSRGEWRPVLFRAEEVGAGAVREYTVDGEGGAAGTTTGRER